MTTVPERVHSFLSRSRIAVRFWTHTIWAKGWDPDRRSRLFRQYTSYLRHAPIPASHLPPSQPSSSASEQQAFCAALRERISALQESGSLRTGVALTFRPLGKNLRLLGTAIRDNAEKGHATAITPGCPPNEERLLASKGYSWFPWIWSRPDDWQRIPDDEARNTAAWWTEYFAQPSPSAIASGGMKSVGRSPRLRRGTGVYSASDLMRTLGIAVATSYAFAPVSAIEERVARLKESCDWPANGEPVLGMHVRRGDAASANSETGQIERSTRVSFPLASYLDAADLICRNAGIRHIYIASESGEDIARARAERPQYQFINVHHDRTIFPNKSRSDQFIEFLALEDPARARALALSAILDLALFRDCSAFVGAFNSEFSVLGWLLATGSREQLVPYISLSKPQRMRSLNPFEALSTKNNLPLDLYHW